MLGAHFKVGDFLKGPARNAVTCLDEAGSGEEGMVIGPYKLLERIGEGGMGVVFMADQHAPVRRRVALKIIKPGMDTREVLARFDAERQALALMDHPNIARALDAGATDSERPYFVMELVRGVPITDYCDQNNLAVHERLALFVDVCRAVQHAHQKGVIHRDIKPTNILVTQIDGRPVPKVIDFGVAKAIHQPLTEQTLFTRFAEMVGTPLYMSPEQAAMTALDIDTRSDIYSLGVLLYELLTGTTPFDKDRLKQAAYDEVRRIIREEEPATPSTRISSLGAKSGVVAAHRHADPRGLSQLVRGDLDWIVMKALEKERSRRYETAIGLAMDVERHLADEPVQACPPSAFYKFRKFARRNRVAFTTSIVVLAAILAGTIVSITQAIRATHAERLAESRLLAETAARADAERASKAEAAQRHIAEEERQQAEANLKRARQAVDQYFTRVSQSKLLDLPTLLPLRKELLQDAARYFQTLLSDRGDDPALLADLAVADLRLAEIDHEVDRNDDAIDAMASGLELVERLHSKFPDAKEEQRRVAGFWKANRDAMGHTEMPRDPAKTERTLVKFVKLWETLAREHPAVVAFQNDLAAAHASLGTWQNAAGRAYGSSDQAQAGLNSCQKAIEIWDRLSQSHPEVPEYRDSLAMVIHELAYWLDATGRRAEAQALTDRDLALCEQLAAEHPNVPQYRLRLEQALGSRGLFLERAGKTRQAAAAFRREFELNKALSREFPTVTEYVLHATTAAQHFLRCSNASGVDAAKWSRQELASVLANLKRVGGNPPQDLDSRFALAQSLKLLAEGLHNAGDPATALSAFQEAVRLYRQLIQEHPQDLKSREQLGHSLKLMVGPLRSIPGRLPDAEQAYRSAIDAFQTATVLEPKKVPNWHFLATTHRELAYLLIGLHRPEEAEQALRRSVDIYDAASKKVLGLQLYHEEEWADNYRDCANFLAQRGRSQDAEEILRRFNVQIEALMRASPGKAVRREWLARAHSSLANIFRDASRMPDAESNYRQALAAYDALIAASGKKPEYQLTRAQCQRDLALLLTSTGRPADAEREYRQLIALKEKLVADSPANPDYRFDLANSCFDLADLLRGNKRPKEAEDVSRQALALYEKLAGEFPSKDNYRVGVGHTLWQVAGTAVDSGRAEKAEKPVRQALAVFEKLTVDFPQNRYYRWEQCFSNQTVAYVLRLLGRVKEAEKPYRDAIDVCEKVLAEAPNDGGFRDRMASSHFDLAEVLRGENRLDEAEKHYRLAKAAWRKLSVDNPTDPGYRVHVIGTCTYQLGPLLAANGRARESEELCREAVGLLASLPASELVADDRRDLTDACYGNLIRLLKSSNRAQEATAVFRAWVDLRRKTFTKSLEQNPKSAEAQNHLGEALARLGCWDEAAAAIDKAADLDPTNHMYLYQAAPLHLRAGDVAGYRRLSRTMLDRFQEAKEPIVADRTAKTCSLAPGSVPDFDRVQKLADRIVKGTEKDAAYRAFVLVKGLAEYRAGRQAEALKWLERFGPHADGSQDVVAFAVRAMAQHRLGQKEQAGAALKSAQAIFAEKMPDPAAGRPFDVLWQNWLQCQILLREAESLVNAKSAVDHKLEAKPNRPSNAATAEPPKTKQTLKSQPAQKP